MGGEEALGIPAIGRSSGLPPRGRGRDADAALKRENTRITPAWAGKRRFRRRFRGQNTDYPRVGGEETRGR